MSEVIDLTSPVGSATVEHRTASRPLSNSNSNNSTVVNTHGVTKTESNRKRRIETISRSHDKINWVLSTKCVLQTIPKDSCPIIFKKQKVDRQSNGIIDVLFTDSEFLPSSRSIDGRDGVKKKNGAGNDPETPKCYCSNIATSKRVRKEGKNQGRYFYCCSKTAKYRCSFFQWCNGQPHTKQAKALVWKRFFSPEYTIAQTHLKSEKTFAPEDIQQGKIGDCWFISAAAVVAERSDLMEVIFSNHLGLNKVEVDNREMISLNPVERGPGKSSLHIPKDGKIIINLCIGGKWCPIALDTFLPVHDVEKASSGGSSSMRTLPKSNLAFAKPGRGKSLWLAYLEKAFAKACGNYHAISGGEIVEAFSVLTGCPTEVINFNDDNFNSDITWGKLLSYSSSKFPMGAGTMSTGEGIVGLHAYSILDVKEIDNVKIGRQQSIKEFFSSSKAKNHPNQKCRPHAKFSSAAMHQNAHLSLDGTLRLLRIRNPWGKKEWAGAFSSGSDAWTSKLRSILKMTNKNDGTFWITYTDFMRRFSNIDVVKAHKDWYNVTFYSLPSKSILDFVDSSVIEIRVHEVTWVQICYFLPHSRGDSTDYFTSYKDVTIVLTKTTANGSPTQVEEVKVLKSNSTCRHQEHLEAILDDTNATYRLYFVRYSKEYSPYTCRIFSANPISSRQIKQSLEETKSFHRILRNLLFKLIHHGVPSQEHIFSVNKRAPTIHTSILSDTAKADMVCFGKIGYVCISNLSVDPVNILMPIGAETKPAQGNTSKQGSSGNGNSRVADKFHKCVWTPGNSRSVTVNGLEQRFVLAGILHDEVLGDGSTTVTSIDENIYISVSSVDTGFKRFFSAFEVSNAQEKATDAHVPFFDSLALFG